MIVASLPFSLEDNPYPLLLQAALRERGVETVEGRARLSWALGARSGVDVVHLHWLELYVHGEGRLASRVPLVAPLLYLLRALRLLTILSLFRLSRTRIVWTVHNIRPHEQRFVKLDALLSRLVARLNGGIVVHSHFARRRLLKEYPWLEGPFWVAPHGNYDDSYPEPRKGREGLRHELGIPSVAFVFLIFGHLRPYKRVDEAIAAFRQLEGEEMHLVVAGAPWNEQVRERIERAAQDDPRVHLRLGFIEERDVADLHAVADAAIIAYPEVFSSGAMLLALTHGLPIVAPGESSATEVALPDAVATFGPGGLTSALAGIREGRGEVRRGAALDSARRHSWAVAAERVHAAYLGRDPNESAG
jgi:beta-1,4-mannosyltransferase